MGRWDRTWSPLAVGAAGWLGVVILAVLRARGVTSTAGFDLQPVRDAGLALRSGHSVYGVPMFVYMPPAAVIGLVLSLVSFHAAVVGYAYLEVAIIAGVVFLMRQTVMQSPWNLAAAAGIAAALLEGDLVLRDIRLENVSLLLVLPCWAIIICWASDRWSWGALILAATLLVKPMLVGLLLIPLLARRWSTVALSVGLTAVVSVVAVPLVSSVGAAAHQAARVVAGSTSTLPRVYNLSLWGLGQVHHTPAVVVVTARAAVVAVVVVAAAAVWRRGGPWDLATVGPLASVLVTGTFLAGSISENHYVLVLLPLALSCLVAARTEIRLVLAGAGVLAAYSTRYTAVLGATPAAVQIRFVLIEILIFAASAMALLARPVRPVRPVRP